MNINLLRKAIQILGSMIAAEEATRGATTHHVLRPLSKLLSTIDETEDLPLKDLNEFGDVRDKLNPDRGGAGAGADKYLARMRTLKALLGRAIAAPIVVATSEFPWIQDPELREMLDRDLAEVEACLEKGHWKAAMVLSGSILEAALYDCLRRNPGWTMSQQGVPQKQDRSPKQIMSNSTDEQWKLEQLVNFSCDNGILEPQIKGMLHSAIREPRNLVHPAAELRRGYKVEEETARASVAALRVALKRLSERKGPTP